MDGFAGETVTAVRTGAGAIAVKVVLPITVPKVAEMVVDPSPVPVASPPTLIVATPEFEEAQTTEVVRSAVLLSV